MRSKTLLELSAERNAQQTLLELSELSAAELKVYEAMGAEVSKLTPAERLARDHADRLRLEPLADDEEPAAPFGLPLQTDRVRTRENLFLMYGELAEANLEQCLAEINAGRCLPEDQRLREAARDGDARLVGSLLQEKRGNPTAPFDLAFPLQYALDRGHVECARLLLPVSGRRATRPDALDAHMARAVQRGQPELLGVLAEWFLRRNVPRKDLAQPDAPGARLSGPNRALCAAARLNDPEAAAKLMSLWAPADPAVSRDQRWRWVLDQAVQTAAPPLLLALLMRLPTTAHESFLSCIYQAYLRDDYAAFETCVGAYTARFGELVSLLDDYLLRAIQADRLNVLRYLVDRGNMTRTAVGVAVRYAVKWGKPGVLRVLAQKYDLLEHLTRWEVWTSSAEVFAALRPDSCFARVKIE